MQEVSTTALRILLVDDEEAILFAVGQYLTGCGYEVDQARNLEEAERLLRACAYAVVVTDLHLRSSADGEGLQVIGEARRHQPATPIVLVTAYGSRETAAEARRRGADRVLDKPLPLALLAQVVRDLTGARP